VTSTFAFDVLGELIGYCPAEQVYIGGCDPSSASEDQAWHWTYDAMGHQATQVPPVNQTVAVLDTTAWAYDAGGRLTSVTDQSAGGTIHRHTDSTYDGVGRLTVAATYQGSGTGTEKVRTTTTYLGDGQPSAIEYRENGSIVDTITETYDAAGRPDLVKRSSTTLTDFNWSPDGTLASRVDGDAGAIGTANFYYDWAKRLASVNLPPGWQTGASSTFTYQPDGLIGSRTWNGGTAATFGYDAAKRITSLTKGSLLSLSQTYDRVGNVTSEARTFTGISGDPGSGTQTFTYDNLNRVTAQTGLAADSSASVQFSYDQDGNRLTKIDGTSAFTYHYDRTDQAIDAKKACCSVLTFGWDSYGNLVSDPESGTGTTSYAYDLAGKLTSITPSGGTATSLTYDALGRIRTRVVPASGTDTYSYLGTTETVSRIANVGGSGTVTDSITDPAGDRLGVRVGTGVNWFAPDLHGSVAGSLSQTETTITSALRYDAYGQLLASGGTGSVGAGYWKYQGRLDVSPGGATSTTLYDAGARFYAPGLGTFTSLDSVQGSAQNPLTMNRFLYGLANPATLIDPDGHAACAYDPQDCAYLYKSNQKAYKKGAYNRKPINQRAYRRYRARKDAQIESVYGRRSHRSSTRAPLLAVDVKNADLRETNTMAALAPRGATEPLECDGVNGCYTASQRDAFVGAVGTAADAVGTVLNIPRTAFFAATEPLGDAQLNTCYAEFATCDDLGQGQIVSARDTVRASFDVVYTGVGVFVGAKGAVDLGRRGWSAVTGTSAASGVGVELAYKEGWSAAQIAAADEKVGALNRAAQQGSLAVSKVSRGGTSAASAFRAAGGDIPSRHDVDHVIDLQLGGLNTVPNLSPLDYSVNRSLGAQIACRLRGLPVGTKIISVTIC
jgi:RHS repeat-associated protein